MIVPLAPPSGTSTSAVIVFDLFLTLMKTFSIIPVMPSASVSDVRPPIRSGRPTMAALRRSNTRSSIGSTWYLRPPS